MAGVNHDFADLCQVTDPRSQSAREVDQRLALVFGRVFLCVGVEDPALGLASLGQRYHIFNVGAAQEPSDRSLSSPS